MKIKTGEVLPVYYGFTGSSTLQEAQEYYKHLGFDISHNHCDIIKSVNSKEE